MEVAKLTASDGSAADEFGLSLGLQGDIAVFGASGSDSRGDASGAAYVFEQRDGRWTQVARLMSNDAATGQTFGWSVAVGDNTIVMEVPNHGGVGEHAGAAYVFERKAGRWTQVDKLFASDAAPFPGFGSTVAITQNRIVVGMLLNGKGQRSGAAYVFERKQGVVGGGPSGLRAENPMTPYAGRIWGRTSVLPCGACLTARHSEQTHRGKVQGTFSPATSR